MIRFRSDCHVLLIGDPGLGNHLNNKWSSYILPIYLSDYFR